MVVVLIRNSLLSFVRQITSSRQSPNTSALSTGVALDPLLELQSSARSSVSNALLFQFHFMILFRSNNSRKGSPSHQTPKLQEPGVTSVIFSPLTENSPWMPAPKTQHSAPG